eukprot:35224-Eustigmatos_ZCMA.PRE.1
MALGAVIIATALDSLEQKLRHYEQSIFTMKEYIESKMRETDYQGQSLRSVQRLHSIFSKLCVKCAQWMTIMLFSLMDNRGEGRMSSIHSTAEHAPPSGHRGAEHEGLRRS